GEGAAQAEESEPLAHAGDLGTATLRGGLGGTSCRPAGEGPERLEERCSRTWKKSCGSGGRTALRSRSAKRRPTGAPSRGTVRGGWAGARTSGPAAPKSHSPRAELRLGSQRWRRHATPAVRLPSGTA